MRNFSKVCLLAIVLALSIGNAFGQFGWTRDPRNPIPLGGSWNLNNGNPCVLFNADSSRYEMWFNGWPGIPGPHGDFYPHYVGFAHSKDGINWTVYPSAVLAPTSGAWDAYTVDQPMVVRENGHYKMWYSSYYYVPPTYPGYIGYATSPDGIQWTKYAGNPVMGLGTAVWDAAGLYTCAVIPFPGGYRMWYAGYDTSGGNSTIGYATSSDGITWQRDTVHNPVLKHGPPSQWDSAGIWSPQVLRIKNTYYMWYAGSRGSGNQMVECIGVATSKDTGITWTTYTGNPAFLPSSGGWDGGLVMPGSVLLRGDTLDMWYTGIRPPYNTYLMYIGHATTLVTAITERRQEVPQDFMLLQNYPNPFNPGTTIKYELPRASLVSLQVYDILGREVSVLVNERKDPGVHEVSFDGSNLASGVYFYRLQTENFVSSKKFILMK